MTPEKEGGFADRKADFAGGAGEEIKEESVTASGGRPATRLEDLGHRGTDAGRAGDIKYKTPTEAGP